MAYNPNINQNISFEVKPMLYKKATIKKEGFWITNFPEGSTDYKKFEAWKCVYFPLNKSEEEFCKEWRTIADKTFYKLSRLKNEALGIATEEVNEQVTESNEESNEVTDNNNDNSKQEPTETEQIQ